MAIQLKTLKKRWMKEPGFREGYESLGEEFELATFDDRDGAIDAAKELVRSFSTAEESGDWPEMEGRFLRPASVASIDVLVA